MPHPYTGRLAQIYADGQACYDAGSSPWDEYHYRTGSLERRALIDGWSDRKTAVEGSAIRPDHRGATQ